MAPQLEMLHRQLEPNMLIFNAAMSASEKGEQRQQAPGMLSEMRKGRWSLMFSFSTQPSAPAVISFGVAMSSILDRQAQHNCSPSNDTVRTHGSLDFGVLVDVVLEVGPA